MIVGFCKILKLQRRILNPISILSRERHNNAIQVTWKKPDIGCTKLNFDGSFREKTGMASIGGVFRNHNAEFILGYAERIGNTTSMVAELAALHRGLELVLENGWHDVWLEGDAKSLVEIIVNRKQAKCEELQSLFRVVNVIIPELNSCYVSHIYREGNRVADKFAKMGHESKKPRIWRNDPPKEILSIVNEDAEGKSVIRRR